jgi:two-component system chemotaxis response regulator CheB
MADDGRQTGRRAVAEMYDERAREYREYADTLRRAALLAFENGPLDENEE